MDIQIHDVMQITPDHDWGGAFLIVTEVRHWGVIGFVEIPKQGQAYIRIPFEQVEKIGAAIFVLQKRKSEES
jgi:sporulation protein YlmC with PRC-barrel domain